MDTNTINDSVQPKITNDMGGPIRVAEVFQKLGWPETTADPGDSVG
jgi:hypothetical protein